MKKEIPILIHRTLNDLADGLIKVFIPVAIYQYTLSLQWVLIYALSYYMIQSLLNLTFYRSFVKAPRVFIFIRTVPLLLAQYILQSSGLSPWVFILLLATATAFSNAFYWVPLNSIFALSTDINLGQSISRFKSASLLSKLVMPILSAIVISMAGLRAVVILSTVIYLLSILVLAIFSMKEKSGDSNHANKVISKKHPNIEDTPLSPQTYFLTYMITGVCDTAEMLWPLFVFIETLRYLDVGFVASLVQLGLIAANFVVGKITDKGRWRKAAVLALVLFSLGWLIRPVYLSELPIYLLSTLIGFASPFFNTPLFATFLRDSKATSSLARNLALREVAIKSGGVVSLAFGLSSGALTTTFFLVPAAALLFIIPILKTRTCQKI